MEKKPLFVVIFEDGKHYTGNTSYLETGWLGILPNKPIKRIFYRLPDYNYLCLEGYEKYFHMIEATNDLTGRNKGKTVIRYAYIIGKRENKVESYRISLFENKDSKYKIGDIVKREFDLNSKFANGLNLDNWRG